MTRPHMTANAVLATFVRAMHFPQVGANRPDICDERTARFRYEIFQIDVCWRLSAVGTRESDHPASPRAG